MKHFFYFLSQFKSTTQKNTLVLDDLICRAIIAIKINENFHSFEENCFNPFY